MADSRRADRIAEAIREETATFLHEDAKDPRIVGFVTITGVEVTADLRYAKIFISVMGTETERRATLDGLESAAPHVRARLGKALRLRHAPEIQFRLDPTVERAARIDTLLAQIRDGETAADEERSG